jgi:hypothetical protein
MNRAGREPAEDVKRRLVAACQEVGLVVNHAIMRLSKEHGVRLIHVDAGPPDWPHDTGMLSVMAEVTVAGNWPETIDIRCIASNDNPVTVAGPWMRGRSNIPFANLIDELLATLREREQVIAMAESGVAGPYVFGKSSWKSVDLLEGFDPF